MSPFLRPHIVHTLRCFGHLSFWEFASGLKILISTPAINHSFSKTLLVFADFSWWTLILRKTHKGSVSHSQWIFSNLWKPCCRFTHWFFIKYQAKWLAAISSDCLDSRCIACQHAKCLRSAVTCGKTPVTVTLSEPLKILQCFVTQ